MYKHIWRKYVPVLKILMKKSEGKPQTLDLNQLDFEGAGVKKSGTRFKIEFQRGHVSNVIHDSPLAVELSNQLLEDDSIVELLNSKNFIISLNSKYQLTIKEKP
ncbi:MAG: hypothetical protein J0H55_10275 [Chitinophagaceae bacterium]|nr:hypothetical protein [Chitinophagaceae bacterium]